MRGEDNLKDHRCASEKDSMSVHLCIARELTKVTFSCDEISTSSILINMYIQGMLSCLYTLMFASAVHCQNDLISMFIYTWIVNLKVYLPSHVLALLFKSFNLN